MSRRHAKQVVVSSDVERRNLESNILDDGTEVGVIFCDVIVSLTFSDKRLSSVNGATGNK